MATVDGPGWEIWPEDVALREVTSFAERAEALTGLSEEQLTRQVGLPSEEAPGTRWESADRALILQADRDLRYFNLLPHVVVSFAISAGIVVRVGYLPKWRKCPPHLVGTLGGAYAPE